MAGIYIHIPFCKSRCIYCGFYSTTRLDLRRRYVEAVCREWQMRRHELAEPVDTIYIGGGTPSLLEGDQLSRLFAVLPAADEVTIEVNPDDVTEQFAATVSRLPVNRVSMGAQTFNDRRLRFLHRRHSATQVAEAVSRLRAAGIGNISIDLMYGFPGETLDAWQQDINEALVLDAEHLSAYCLMVEEGTVLYEQMRNEKLEMRNDGAEEGEELERQMYETLIDRLTTAGYEHYEISNFARPGYRSRHNSSYWHDTAYVGLGAAAHSYSPAQHTRSWNTADLHAYIDSIEQGQLPCEREHIDGDTHYNDLVTTALRTSDGLCLDMLSDRHRRYCLGEARTFLASGLLRLDGQRLGLTRRGLFLSDMVMSGLMLV